MCSQNVWGGENCMPQHMCKRQGTILLNKLHPSTSMWILGFELMSPGLRSKYLCSLNRFTVPFLVSKLSSAQLHASPQSPLHPSLSLSKPCPVSKNLNHRNAPDHAYMTFKLHCGDWLYGYLPPFSSLGARRPSGSILPINLDL